MSDHIVRVIAKDGSFKAAAISGRQLVERARNIHTLLPVATAALGRTLMAASMMGDALKEQNGTLTVIKDIGLKEPYVGSIGLFSGEIADDLAMYFVESEQIPTACALGVLVGTDQSVTAAGGYLIQLLPGAEESVIDRIEAGIQRVGPVSGALAGGLDGEGLLRAVLADFELEILETHPVEYKCYCSRERVTRALISMGRQELSALIEEQGQAELTCQFCDKVYRFSREELEELLSNM